MTSTTTSTVTILQPAAAIAPSSSLHPLCSADDDDAAAAAPLVIPLSFLDFLWLHFIPIRRLLFYRCPSSCSKSHFLSTLLPQLTQSLSLALRHYLPVAGNLLYPIKAAADDDDDDDDDANIKKPFIRYVPGDSVPLTVAAVAESESDVVFDELIAHHPRDADRFYDFIPEMPPITQQGEYNLVPLMAFQITLFPDRGICIGFANHHILGDASSIVRFISTWAEINNKLLLGGEGEGDPHVDGLGLEELLLGDYSHSPIFDRSLISDPLGIDSIYWKTMRKMPLRASSFPLPTHRVRATYTLLPCHIKKLKNLINLAAKTKNIPAGGLVVGSQVSSFVVTAAYIWTCLVRSRDVEEEEEEDEVDDESQECFIFTADVRARVDPPVPANYFGNCLGGGMAKLEHRELVVVGDWEEGFRNAAEAIAEYIRKTVNNKDEVLKGAENWLSSLGNLGKVKCLGVSGSPRHDLCGADFGWGRAMKLEVLSIDAEKYSMSLCRSSSPSSGQGEGGLEIGLSLPKSWMQAFAFIFALGLS